MQARGGPFRFRHRERASAECLAVSCGLFEQRHHRENGRSGVEAETVLRECAVAATGDGLTLQHGDAVAGAGEVHGCGQAGQPRAHHDDLPARQRCLRRSRELQRRRDELPYRRIFGFRNDVSRGGFSGAQFSLRTRPGSNFMTRGMSLNLDAPQLQWTDRAARARGRHQSVAAGVHRRLVDEVAELVQAALGLVDRSARVRTQRRM